ncbi:hypothetical protein [Brevundimonas sp.]|uniref:hypothetical protein n=1 Tax=Brevundimonas sp. TaxID=1871086 RepID=UPI002FC68161
MLTVALIAAAALSVDAGQAVSIIAPTSTPAQARQPGDQGATRRVCRFQRATGSNLQQRVCRDIPIAGVQDQQTRDFLRNLQRVRLPDGG